MRKYNVKNFVFSSSATVYGDPPACPSPEDFPTGGTTNPYGTTKVIMEQILTDYCKADPTMNVALLRYFNPIGAHESGLIGEDPNGIPNNLVPYIAKVAVGTLEKVHVFGNDYPTPDGTGVRDYIHVVDLARGHVGGAEKAGFELRPVHLQTWARARATACWTSSKAYSKACGKDLPYVIDPRRPGDIAECYADPAKARDELGWTAEYGIEEMCASSWKWQSMNPNGYKGAEPRPPLDTRIRSKKENNAMNKPVLVVMAAGMGSRYGGLKQIDPVGGHGQLIIDYSIFDARRAGLRPWCSSSSTRSRPTSRPPSATFACPK